MLMKDYFEIVKKGCDNLMGEDEGQNVEEKKNRNGKLKNLLGNREVERRILEREEAHASSDNLLHAFTCFIILVNVPPFLNLFNRVISCVRARYLCVSSGRSHDFRDA